MLDNRTIGARVAGVVLGAVLAATPIAATAVRAQDAGPTLSKPWIRMVMPSRPAAGYFQLSNPGDTGAALTGAESTACGSVMLHRSVTRNGQATMEMVKSIKLMPHGTILFSPGGYHLMCMEPTEAVVPGKTVQITLKFADGTSLTGDFEVRGAAGN